MALEIKFRTTSYSANNTDKKIYFKDVTGFYDENTNQTGYGGPNVDRLIIGIFFEAKKHTILDSQPKTIELKYEIGANTEPSQVTDFYLESPVDGNYSVEYLGVVDWNETTTYAEGQVIHEDELLYIATTENFNNLPSEGSPWAPVLETETVPTIPEVISNPSEFDKADLLYPGHTIVLSTMESDRRYVDMVTAKENLTCFYDGTLDDDSITNYRVLLYGAKANAFVECDINGIYLLRGCNDIYKAAKIKCSNLI